MPEGKSEVPPTQRAKDPDVKAKEPDSKPKDSDSKPKDPESKPVEQKSKEADAKLKEGETKAKDAESKPKDQDLKQKDPAAKAKEPETKSKEVDAVPEHPCPSVPHAAEAKPAVEALPPSSEGAAGDRPKAPEPEVKKPMKSSMVTAKLAFMADPRLFPYDIEVDVKEKDLVLLGKVSQESDKKVATDIVRCLEGVHAVENRLKVEPDATRGLVAERDKVLTQLVKERFEKSKTLQSVKFDVKTEDGVVTLNGTTRFQVIVLEAAQAARQVPGVRAVNTESVRLVAGE
jgi:hyperosmotically inducible protein